MLLWQFTTILHQHCQWFIYNFSPSGCTTKRLFESRSFQLYRQHLYSIRFTRTVLPTLLFVDEFNLSNTFVSIFRRFRSSYWSRPRNPNSVKCFFNIISTWSKMIIKKCKRFEIMKKSTTSTHIKAKLYVNNKVTPLLKDNESFSI